MSGVGRFEKTPLQTTKGAVRNLTHLFLKQKHHEEHDPRDRYVPHS
jgi:hypothetical protein